MTRPSRRKTGFRKETGLSGSLAHNQIELTSLLRAGACGVLFGLALAGPCALLAAWLRSGIAVVVAAVYVGAAYLVTLIAPVFDWPAWTERPSVFWAFAHPYLSWPPWGGFLVLVVGAVGGALAAAWVSERRPKVA